MGWTYVQKQYATIDEFFEKSYLSDNYEFLGKGYLVNLTEYYRAIRNKKTNQIFALVCLIDLSNKWQIGYKDMTEDMGPCVYNCPKKVLDIIEQCEPSCKWAKEWREKCHEVLNKRQKAKGLKNGDIVQFSESISFSNGNTYNRFKVIVYKGKKHLYALTDNNSCVGEVHIRNWRTRDFEII